MLRKFKLRIYWEMILILLPAIIVLSLANVYDRFYPLFFLDLSMISFLLAILSLGGSIISGIINLFTKQFNLRLLVITISFLISFIIETLVFAALFGA